MVPPGLRVVPRSAIIGDMGVAPFASKKVRVNFVLDKVLSKNTQIT